MTSEDRRLEVLVVGPLRFEFAVVFGAKAPSFCVNVRVSTVMEGSC